MIKHQKTQPQEALWSETNQINCEKWLLSTGECGQKERLKQVAAVSNRRGCWVGEGRDHPAHCCFSPTVVKPHMCITRSPPNSHFRHIQAEAREEESHRTAPVSCSRAGRRDRTTKDECSSPFGRGGSLTRGSVRVPPRHDNITIEIYQNAEGRQTQEGSRGDYCIAYIFGGGIHAKKYSNGQRTRLLYKCFYLFGSDLYGLYWHRIPRKTNTCSVLPGTFG